MASAYGMPIWYELITTDTDAAKRFYGDIVGWKASAFPGPAGGQEYGIFNAGETGVGGLLKLPEGAPTGPGWFAYFHVADVDAAVAEIENAGGKVHMPAMDIPGVGRTAMVADPQGVVFYVMTPDPSMGDQDSTVFSATLPQRCSWNELVTSDQEAALPFYTALLGWTSTEAMPMGEMGDYTFVDCDGERLGAMMDRAHVDQPLKWTFYFHIPDVDAAVEKVKAGGGTIVMGPMDVPGGQRVIICVDPQGASVGFVSGERA